MDMREYELMYIVRPTVTEEQLPGVNDHVDSMIANLGGEVREKLSWGKRRLAYPIDKHEDGYYMVDKISLDNTRTRDLEAQLRIYDEVIRHILVLATETPTPAPTPTPTAAPTQAPAPATTEE